MIENLDFAPVPNEAENIFRMCWQFENWLRQIVYVRLRANRVDWEGSIKKVASKWPPRAKESDKKLSHMPTPHEAEISFLSFGELWKIVENEWELFKLYFPERKICDVRIADVKAVRNRIAHFRKPSEYDEIRVKLFMHEMEAGLRKFCRQYTQEVRLKNVWKDPLAQALKDDWNVIGRGVECLVGSQEWLYSSDDRMSPRINVDLSYHYFGKNPSVKSGSDVIYRVGVHAARKDINVPDLFAFTKSFHKDLVHFVVSDRFATYFTIPAVIGASECFDIVSKIIDVALNSCCSVSPTSLEHCRKTWPEYVLWPDHHLVYFWDEVKDSLIEHSKGDEKS